MKKSPGLLQSTVVPLPSSRLFWLAILLLYALAFAGTRGLWNPDEGRYTAVAINMVDSGQWIVPRLNDDQLHFTKPPLTYWAIAASVKLLGRSEWAIRLPYALAFFVTVLAVYGIGRRLVPDKPWLPALLYALSPVAYMAAHIVTTDTLLTLWETLAVFGFVSARFGSERAASRRWIALMWAAFGLAFLTKGPPGLLPLFSILLFVILCDGWCATARLFNIAGLAAFAVLGFGWFMVVVAQNPQLLKYFLYNEVVQRAVSSEHHRNPQWYGWIVVYVPALLGGVFPWLWDLARARPALKRNFPDRWRLAALKQRPEAMFLLIWFCLPLAIFCVARSRLALYILPLFVPMALLMARVFKDRFVLSTGRLAYIGAWIVLLAGARAGMAFWPSEKDTRTLAAALEQAPTRPQEVLFVDAPPYYGLRFYLNAEVEAVTVRSTPEGLEPLSDELATHEPNRIFVVPEKRQKRFLRTVGEAGMTVTQFGASNEQGFYCLDGAQQAKPLTAVSDSTLATLHRGDKESAATIP